MNKCAKVREEKEKLYARNYYNDMIDISKCACSYDQAVHDMRGTFLQSFARFFNHLHVS